jgi:thymidylate kinase
MSGTLVEFCGLPGAGKTSLAAATLAALAEAGVPCRVVDQGVSAATSRPARVARRAASVLVEACAHPVRTAGVATRVVKARPGTVRDTVAVLAQWLALQRLLDRSHGGDGVRLLEEGEVQTLWTLGLRARRHVAVPRWERRPAAVRPDLLVVVQAPVEVALERLDERASKHSRTQRLPAARRRAELTRGEDLLERILAEARAPVVRLCNDGTAPLCELANHVASHCR